LQKVSAHPFRVHVIGPGNNLHASVIQRTRGMVIPGWGNPARERSLFRSSPGYCCYLFRYLLQPEACNSPVYGSLFNYVIFRSDGPPFFTLASPALNALPCSSPAGFGCPPSSYCPVSSFFPWFASPVVTLPLMVPRFVIFDHLGWTGCTPRAQGTTIRGGDRQGSCFLQVHLRTHHRTGTKRMRRIRKNPRTVFDLLPTRPGHSVSGLYSTCLYFHVT